MAGRKMCGKAKWEGTEGWSRTEPSEQPSNHEPEEMGHGKYELLQQCVWTRSGLLQ